MKRRTKSDKRNLILETAFKVFGESGYESTTIQDIAQEAGIAQGSVYTYFRDKEDLFRATVEAGWEELLREIDNIRQSRDDVANSIKRVLHIGLNLLTRSLPLVRGMLFTSTKMQLLPTYLDRLFASVDELISDLRGEYFPTLAENREERLTAIKVAVLGTFLSAALAEPEEQEKEMRSLRRYLLNLLENNLLVARGTVGTLNDKSDTHNKRRGKK